MEQITAHPGSCRDCLVNKRAWAFQGSHGLFRRAAYVAVLPPYVPLPQAVAFLAGSVMAPVLLGAAAIESGMLPAAAGAVVERNVLSKKAIEQRIEFALRGLAADTRRTS